MRRISSSCELRRKAVIILRLEEYQSTQLSHCTASRLASAEYDWLDTVSSVISITQVRLACQLHAMSVANEDDEPSKKCALINILAP